MNIFRTSSPGDRTTSQVTLKELLPGGEGELGYIGVLEQSAGGLNIKKWLLIKGNQICQVKEFSAFLVLTFPLWVPGNQQLHQINSEGWSHLSACKELASGGGQPSVSGDYEDHIWTWPSAGGPRDRMSSEFQHRSSFMPLLRGWAAHHLTQLFICSKKTTDSCSQVRASMSATTFP